MQLQNKEDSPSNSACLVRDIVYAAKAISMSETKYYTGAAKCE